MISHKDKYDALNRILQSKVFSKATTMNVLLKFLVESTIHEKEISAIIIGLELFGQKYDSEKSDVNVRVNISHLRKRLKHYYEHEGAEDKVIISIVPGQYSVSFLAKEELQKNSVKKIWISGAVIILVSVIISVFLFSKKKDKVWERMFDNKYETTLYLGDVFGYSGPTAFGNSGWHRDFKVNSPEEFYSATSKDPERYRSLSTAKFSFVVFENACNIKPFTQFFYQQNYDFLIRPNSDFKIRSIKDRNTIYAGAYFTQSVFTDLFNDFSINVKLEIQNKISKQYLYCYSSKGSVVKSININSRYNEGEYAIASAFTGPNNSRHYLFFSNHGLGLSAVVEYFTNPDSVRIFSKKYLSNTDEFVALYFVKGQDRTNLSMELVHFDDNRTR